MKSLKQILKKKFRGFTIMELMVTISILAVIASVSISNFRQAEKVRSMDLSAQIALEAYRKAQNYSLTGKIINEQDFGCFIDGEWSLGGPPTYGIHASAQPTIQPHMFGKNECGLRDVEFFNFPSGVKIKPGTFVINGIPNNSTEVYIHFKAPYGKLEYTAHSGTWDGFFYPFVEITFDLELPDGSLTRTIRIDGISGRIDIL